MLKKLEWLDVKNLIKRANIILIYKISNGYLGSYLDCFLNKRSSIHHHNTRNRNNFDVNRIKSSKMKKSLFGDGLKYYNDLPNDVKEADNIKSFTYMLDNYLLLDQNENPSIYIHY